MKPVNAENVRARISQIERAIETMPGGFSLGINHEFELACLRELLSCLESEPVALIDQANLDYLSSGADADVWPPGREEMGDVLLYRHAQPSPEVPVVTAEDCPSFVQYNTQTVDEAWAIGYNACRAAMLNGGKP